MNHSSTLIKELFSLFFLIVLLFSSDSLHAQKLRKGLARITPELMEQHIAFLASDSMKGRKTPGPELDRAADYLAAQFSAMGIETVHGERFQEVPLYTKNLDGGSLPSREGKMKSFRLKTDYTLSMGLPTPWCNRPWFLQGMESPHRNLF